MRTAPVIRPMPRAVKPPAGHRRQRSEVGPASPLPDSGAPMSGLPTVRASRTGAPPDRQREGFGNPAEPRPRHRIPLLPRRRQPAGAAPESPGDGPTLVDGQAQRARGRVASNQRAPERRLAQVVDADTVVHDLWWPRSAARRHATRHLHWRPDHVELGSARASRLALFGLDPRCATALWVSMPASLDSTRCTGRNAGDGFAGDNAHRCRHAADSTRPLAASIRHQPRARSPAPPT